VEVEEDHQQLVQLQQEQLILVEEVVVLLQIIMDLELKAVAES
jgi:hypothetical protein